MKAKINQYRKDGKNLFSSSEKIMAAFLCPDLYLELMPPEYQNDPIQAAHDLLDGPQRTYVWNRKSGIVQEAI